MTGVARILERCVPINDCLIWTGATNSKGYGSVSAGVKGKTALAHRVVFTEMVGPIENGLTVDHICRNKLCQNYAHMEIVTRGENSRRGIAAQTECRLGHPLSGENLRVITRSNGYSYRVCVTCSRRHRREYMRRVRQAVAS